MKPRLAVIGLLALAAVALAGVDRSQPVAAPPLRPERPPAAERDLVRELESPNPSVRRRAYTTLQKNYSTKVRELIAALEDPREDLMGAIVRCRRNGEKLESFVAPLLVSKEKESAARKLGRLRAREAIPLLIHHITFHPGISDGKHRFEVSHRPCAEALLEMGPSTFPYIADHLIETPPECVDDIEVGLFAEIYHTLDRELALDYLSAAIGRSTETENLERLRTAIEQYKSDWYERLWHEPFWEELKPWGASAQDS